MVPEFRLLHEELNAFTRIAVKQTGVIIVPKVVGIGYTIGTHFAGFPSIDRHYVGHFVEPFK
jgi:hypothetical protein